MKDSDEESGSPRNPASSQEAVQIDDISFDFALLKPYWNLYFTTSVPENLDVPCIIYSLKSSCTNISMSSTADYSNPISSNSSGL